jgi:hypothetical protein
MTEAVRLPLALCPYCGAKNDAATHIGRTTETPRAGDVSICFSCVGIMVYEPQDGRLILRKPTAAEFFELRADSTIAKFRAQVIRSAREHGRELK